MPPAAPLAAVAGLKSRAIREGLGAISRRRSSHLPPSDDSKFMNPVIEPPGRARLSTKPLPIGSATFTKTIGVPDVTALIAAVQGVGYGTMTSSSRLANSVA